MQSQALMRTVKSPLNPEFVWSVYSKTDCYQDFKIINSKERNSERGKKRKRESERGKR